MSFVSNPLHSIANFGRTVGRRLSGLISPLRPEYRYLADRYKCQPAPVSNSLALGDDLDNDSLTYSDTASECSSLRMDDLGVFDDLDNDSLTYSDTASECSSLRMDDLDVFDSPVVDSGTDPEGSLRMDDFVDKVDDLNGFEPTAEDTGREVSRVEVEVGVVAVVAVVPPVEAAPVLRRSKRLEAVRRRRSSSSRTGKCANTRATRASVKAGRAKLLDFALA